MRNEPRFRRASLIDAIKRAGALPGLYAAFDPADINCYPGSGQTLFDLSGNGNDAWLGNDSGATNDPAFFGVPGTRRRGSGMQGAGGGSCCTFKTQTTFLNSMHKAGAAWTVLTIGCGNNTGISSVGDSFAVGSPGIQLLATVTSGVVGNQLLVYRADGNNAYQVLQNSGIDSDSSAGRLTRYTMSIVGVDFTVGNALLQLNDIQEIRTASLTTPAATNAGNTMQFGGSGGGTNLVGAGGTFGVAAFWTRMLPPNIAKALFAALNPRFSLSSHGASFA